MKYFNRISIALISLAAAFGLSTGCVKEQEQKADAVMVSESGMTFAATASEQVLTIYADGTWVADVTDDWFTINPTAGSGTVDVTVAVDENLGAEPRQGSIIIKASSQVADVEVTVYQKNDRFRETAESKLADAVAAEVGTLVKIPGCQVVAFTTSGFVVSQDGTSMYVLGVDKTLAEGDIITVTGDVAEQDGIKGIKLEDAFKTSTAEVAAGEPVDLAAAESMPAGVAYVTFEGSYVGKNKINVNDKPFGIFVDPVAALNVEQWERHKIAVTGYYIGEASSLHAIVVTGIEDKGLEGEVIAQFEIETSAFADANKTTFPTTMSFAAISGAGTISYVPYDLPSNNANNKFVMDISGNDPRCTGPWPEDYWLFVAESPVKANSEYQIKFGARTSATGHKYWIVEYLDGTIWKTAGTELVSEDMPAGTNVVYTHAMNSDGSTNVAVSEKFSVTKNMDKLQVRFRCVANWQANGNGALECRNGGSARLAVKNAYQPTMILLKEGDGAATEDPEPEYANIECSAKTITFEGMPAEPKTITVKSDRDFTIKQSASWFELSVFEGVAGEPVEVAVTCQNNEKPNLREGSITIVSGDSSLEIPVIQSAAGQDLDPFISLGRNSVEVGYKSQSVTVNVQATEAYTVKSDVEWIALEPFTKTVVAKTEETLYINENDSSTETRVGHVVFAIESLGVETVLTVTQGCKPAAPTNVVFEDDFEWMRSYIDYYNANSGKTVGKTIEDKNASANSPQIYDANFVGLTDAFAARGWSDLNAAGKMVYINDAYLKFSKTGGNNTAVAISLEQYLPSAMDVTVAFDYAMQIQGSGTVDAGPIVLQIVGDGTFANGTKVSEEFNTAQQTGELFWNNVKDVRINGATGNTKVVFINKRVLNDDGTYNWSVSGAGRFFLDNVKIEKAKAAPQVVWNDDFSWLKEMIETYNAANSKPIGNSVEGHTPEQFADASGANAPNAYTAEPFKSQFPAALAAAGYTDLNASAKVIYPQDMYLKFGKTNAHTSLQFAPFKGAEAANYELSFDWCRHVQGTATIDPVTLTVVIVGDGMFENGTKYSDPLETPQKYQLADATTGATAWAEMFWTNSKVTIYGATESTKINIVYTDCLDKATGTYTWTVSGAHRYHIDNIKVVK